MSYAHLFAGIAIGSFVPWVVMLFILRSKDRDNQNAAERQDIPNQLLRERNEIGRLQISALQSIARAIDGHADRRERIAALVLQGYLAGRSHDSPYPALETNHHKRIAESSLKYADALIEELDGEINANGDMLDALETIRTVATAQHHPNALNAIRGIAQREIDIARGKEDA